jgi:O-methyltransferase
MVATDLIVSRYPLARPTVEPSTPEELYLDLLKKCLTRLLFPDAVQLGARPRGRRITQTFFRPVRHWLTRQNLMLARAIPFSVERRVEGLDWPVEAETMIGIHRLNNIQECVTDILRRGVPGDFIETGVWRGGAVIFMRAILKAYQDTDRVVWAADSFQGLPQPDPDRYPADAGDTLWMYKHLAVSEEQVRANFARYGLLDDQVRFLVGWFRDTLPTAPIERLALMRLDGDMYESTMDALRHLYPKLSIGGYVIVDDFDAVPGCPLAIHDFRAEHGISEPLQRIDRLSVFWQRER